MIESYHSISVDLVFVDVDKRNNMCSHNLDDDLEKFIVDVLKASSKGVSALRNATSEPNWSFGQALFFSTTVVTTIGAHFLSSHVTSHIDQTQNNLPRI